MNVLWGKLASEILMQDWDNALDDLNRLREVLDSNVCVFLHCRFVVFIFVLFVIEVDGITSKVIT